MVEHPLIECHVDRVEGAGRGTRVRLLHAAHVRFWRGKDQTMLYPCLGFGASNFRSVPSWLRKPGNFPALPCCPAALLPVLPCPAALPVLPCPAAV